MSGKRTTRRASGELRKGSTDWKRVQSLDGPAVERGAAADPDNPLWSKEDLEWAQLIAPSGETKVPVSIRLDPEVLEYFKAQGPGYQSRIGAVLLAYVRRRRGP